MERPARLAVVDDDADIRDALTEYLRLRGFAVVACGDGAALTRALAGGLDAVLLDLNLPGESGLDLVRRLRADPSRPGILLVTGEAGIADRVAGLELGADDYVPKPVDLRELLARIRSVLRRRQAPAASATLVATDGEAPEGRAPDGPHAAFAMRLRRATLRGNLGRGQIARDVGADKSAVSRWFNGTVRPNENSLVALTDLLAARLPGFSRDVWDASEAVFARAIGESALARTPAAPSATLPTAGGAAELLARFGGLWLGFFPYTATGRWLAGLMEIGAGPDGAPAMKLGAASQWAGEGDPVFDDGQLWIPTRQTEPRPGFACFTYWGGASGRVAVMDGLLLVRATSLGGPPTASRTVAFRLGTPAGPPFTRHAAAVAKLRSVEATTWQAMAQPALDLVAPVGAEILWSLAVPAAASLAVDAGGLAALESAAGPRRAAQAALREAFAAFLETPAA